VVIEGKNRNANRNSISGGGETQYAIDPKQNSISYAVAVSKRRRAKRLRLR